jgi:hypothetical protein
MRSPSRKRYYLHSFQPNLFSPQRFKEPQTTTQEYRHDVNVDLVNHAGFESLLSGTGTPYDCDIFGAGSRFGPFNRPFDVLIHEGEG